jgi:glutamyl/glutaminyl-tRNA synthetase
MKLNTRFNPTVNGRIHCGHLYTAIVNEVEAHMSGGKFIVRFDDDQTFWSVRRTPTQVQEAIDSIVEDLDWMGVQVDEWQNQTTMKVQAEMQLLYFNHGPLNVRNLFYNDTLPIMHGKTYTPYPYVPWITAEKVIMDFMGDINLLVRGEDLAGEFSLYQYFIDLWGLRPVKQVFLPRLLCPEMGEVGDLSKTIGNYKVADLRSAGMEPGEVRHWLAASCLEDEDGPWSIENVKAQPMLTREGFGYG